MQTKTEKVFVHKVSNAANAQEAVNSAINNLSIASNKKILIKPNFVCPRPSNTGATTDLELIELVVKSLVNKGLHVTIGEGAGFEFDTDKVFEILGVDSLAKKYYVSLVNLRKAKTEKVNINGKALKKIKLPKPLLDADYIINMPKFKTHMLTGMTFAMKNFIGVLPEEERRRAHMHGIDQPVVDLVKHFENKSILTIGDAITTMGGPGGPGYGQAIQANTLVIGQNNMAVDEASFNLFGIDTSKVRYLQIAKTNPGFPKIELVNKIEKMELPFPVPDAGFLYKFSYRIMHTFDYLTSPLHKESLIPQIATKIGTRAIIGEACDKCGKCIESCPVNAISKDYQIDFETCRYVRCLKCRDVCHRNAILTKGFLFSKSSDKQ